MRYNATTMRPLAPLLLCLICVGAWCAEVTRKDVDAAANAYLLTVANYAMTLPKPSVPRPAPDRGVIDSKAEEAKIQAADGKWKSYDSAIRTAERLRKYAQDPKYTAGEMEEIFTLARQLHTGLAVRIEYIKAP